jgi:hypothetical protein
MIISELYVCISLFYIFSLVRLRGLSLSLDNSNVHHIFFGYFEFFVAFFTI